MVHNGDESSICDKPTPAQSQLSQVTSTSTNHIKCDFTYNFLQALHILYYTYNYITQVLLTHSYTRFTYNYIKITLSYKVNLYIYHTSSASLSYKLHLYFYNISNTSLSYKQCIFIKQAVYPYHTRSVYHASSVFFPYKQFIFTIQAKNLYHTSNASLIINKQILCSV